MTKKIIIAVVTVCLLSVIVCGFLLLRKQNTSVNQPLINAVPVNVSVIVAVNDPSQLFEKQLKNNSLWKTLLPIAPFSSIDSLLFDWIEFVNHNTADKDKSLPRSMYISWHANGVGQFEKLYVVALHNDLEAEVCPKLLPKYLNAASPNNRMYDNETIYELPNTGLSFAVMNKMLIISLSRTLIEQSILQQHHQRSLLNDASFQPVWKTTTHAQLSVFVNLRNTPQLINSFGNKSFASPTDAIGNFAGWVELDATFSNEHCLFNGFISNELHDFTRIFNAQDAVEMKALSFIPASTEQLLWFGASKVPLLLHDIDGYLTANNKTDAWHLMQKRLNDTCGLQATVLVASLLKDEFALVVNSDAGGDSLARNFFIMSVESQTIAMEQMRSLIDSFAKRNNIDPKQLVSESSIDDETKLTILKLPLDNIPACIAGPQFANIAAEYCTSVDNYLLFAHSPAALTKYVHTVILKKTLDNDANFRRFASNLSEKANLYYFNNISLSIPHLKEWVSDEVSQQLETGVDVYGKLYGLAFQLSGGGELLYSDLLFGDIPSSDHTSQHATWETLLDTCVASQPQLLPVHDSPDRLVFVQDARNTLYCINKAGRVVWRKSIDSKILSSIYPLDYYRNGKIQYACNTAKRLYIIDKLGNFVERYPLDLPFSASCGMALFDYDNSREYRILIPGTDKRIYLFDKNGNVLKDWNAPHTDDPLTLPVQHVRLQDKDYLIAADLHKVYVFNRKGEMRVQVKENFRKSPLNKFYLEKNAKGVCLSTSDASGNVRRVYFDGQVETVSFANFSANHFFIATDINKDTKTDYIFIDGYKLIAYNADKSIVFSFNFDNPIQQEPVIYEFANQTLLAVVDTKSNQTYLFHADGALFAGFPRAGSTPLALGAFDSRNNSLVNVLVGGSGNYLFNYDCSIK